MTLAVDITDGRGLSNEALHELLPKKRKVMLYLQFITRTSCTLLTRWSTSVLKSGRAMRVARLIKEDWPIVLR